MTIQVNINDLKRGWNLFQIEIPEADVIPNIS